MSIGIFFLHSNRGAGGDAAIYGSIKMKNKAITEDHLFKIAYNKGKKLVRRTLVLYVLRDRAYEKLLRDDPRHKEFNRTGLTVGKKLGGATERVRARRLLREAYRRAEGTGLLRYGYLIVIAARTAAVHATADEVERDLMSALREASLIAR